MKLGEHYNARIKFEEAIGYSRLPTVEPTYQSISPEGVLWT